MVHLLESMAWKYRNGKTVQCWKCNQPMRKDATVVRLAVIWEKYTRPFHRDCALKFLTEQIEDIQSERFDDTILSPMELAKQTKDFVEGIESGRIKI